MLGKWEKDWARIKITNLQTWVNGLGMGEGVREG